MQARVAKSPLFPSRTIHQLLAHEKIAHSFAWNPQKAVIQGMAKRRPIAEHLEL
jgi:hypothetical protein